MADSGETEIIRERIESEFAVGWLRVETILEIADAERGCWALLFERESTGLPFYRR